VIQVLNLEALIPAHESDASHGSRRQFAEAQR